MTLAETRAPSRANGLMAALAVGVPVFVGTLALSALAVATGVVPDDTVRLWAGATAAGDGNVTLGRIVAAYPTLPFLATTLLAFLAPTGTPAPALLAAAMLAVLAGYWLRAFENAGLPRAAAMACAIPIAFHPSLLRAAVGGPAEICLAVFVFLFGKALYDLRARSGTSEVMAVGLALLGLAFSHPMGAATVAAAAPLLVFAVRPMLVANSAPNIVIALLFPTAFALGAFAYVSWVFPGDGWSFLAAPAETLATWSAGATRMIGDVLPLSVAAGLAALIVLALGAPVAVVAAIRVRQRRPLLVPALVLPAIVALAAAMTVATGLFGDPAAVAVAAPAMAALAITHVAFVRERPLMTLPLVLLGWFGGAAGLVLIDPAAAARISAAIEGHTIERERLDTLAAGGAMIARDGILVDTDNAPAIVVGRGTARRLIDPSAQAFALALMLARLDTPFVAVPEPHGAIGVNDRINKTFPALYRSGAPGYELVYQNNTWRLFRRRSNASVYRN